MLWNSDFKNFHVTYIIYQLIPCTKIIWELVYIWFDIQLTYSLIGPVKVWSAENFEYIYSNHNNAIIY